MGDSKRKLKLASSNPDPSPQVKLFIVTLTLQDKSLEIHEDVVQFGPVQGQDLLTITLIGGETIVYPIKGNIRKYVFRIKEQP
jgi:hypothetical protein